MKEDNRILEKFEGQLTRPISLSELELILIRFKIMIETEPDRLTAIEFIEQEDFRRNIFNGQYKQT